MDKEGKISFALSFVSGFIDTAGFIALLGLFTAHVTGNLVLAGASFFDQNNIGNLAPKLCMLPVFIMVVMFASYLIKQRQTSLAHLILMEALLIICFSVIGKILIDKTSGLSNNAILIIAFFAVAGMAIQNTYMRKLLNHYTANTVMTGNLTQFSISLFDVLFYFFDKNKEVSNEQFVSVLHSLKKTAIVLMGFLTGCSLGAFFVIKLGLLCCLLPAGVLLWVRGKINSP